MSPAARKFVLVAHVTSSVGFLGAVVAFLALAVVGLTGDDAWSVRAAYVTMAKVTWYVIVPLNDQPDVSRADHAAGPPPYFVVIDRALRDEGTSYHYAAPSEFAEADPALVAAAAEALARLSLGTVAGASWTTDAPFRETAEAIAAARAKGILAVEMEAAALYTYAKVSGARILCLAHVTNTMGLAEQTSKRVRPTGRGMR
jgi:nucleoside phosphorylase